MDVAEKQRDDPAVFAVDLCVRMRYACPMAIRTGGKHQRLHTVPEPLVLLSGSYGSKSAQVS